jgi:hypothetical protein
MSVRPMSSKEKRHILGQFHLATEYTDTYIFIQWFVVPGRFGKDAVQQISNAIAANEAKIEAKGREGAIEAGEASKLTSDS